MDYNGPSYADLPMEIVLRIYGYLNPSDIGEASLVCRQWFDASLHSRFISNLRIRFDKLQLGDMHSEPLNIFARSTRNYKNIQLCQVDVDQTSLDFWRRFGPYFTEIVFHSCDLHEKTFNDILKNLKNLKSLEINNCRELFMSGRLLKSPSDNTTIAMACENVTCLSLCNNRYLSDALFNRVVCAMKHIQKLNLSGCYISFHSGLYRKFYPDHQQEPSESVFTFHAIMQFIESRAPHLKHLDFSETLIDGNALNRLSEVNELKLESLELRSCDQLTTSKIFEKQTDLLTVDLSKSVRITDPSLIGMTQTLNHLKVLKIRKCRAITDLSIKNLRHLKQLEILDVSECDITSKGFIEGIANESHEHLIELHASALNICEMSIIKIAESLKNLRHLDLSFCKNAVTNLGVQMIFKHLIYLRTLNLEFCDMVSDAGITGMEMNSLVENYENRTENDGPIEAPVQNVSDGNDEVDHPYQISLRSKAEEDIVNEAKRKKTMLLMCEQSITKEDNCSQYSIALLKGLRSLNLNSCNRISDVSLKFSFDFLELEDLSLSKCQQISAFGIESALSKCPSIKTLNLSDCHNLSDDAIDMISSRLLRLTHLNIERCSQLTDKTLDSIAMNCKRLKYLDVRGCRFMCPEQHILMTKRSIQHILMSKPGPYMKPGPKAPPMPSLLGRL